MPEAGEEPDAEDGGELLPVVECGEAVLRRPAAPVDPSAITTPELQRLIARMRATMRGAPGVGLAAPQIGESIQLAVLEDDAERLRQLDPAQLASRERTPLPFTVLVNPKLVPVEGEWASFYEGCLSVPGLTGLVTRHRTVRVEALDEHGEPVIYQFVGWPGRIVQHEVDHLGGVLYLDRAEPRSLATTTTYAARWAGRPPEEPAAELGFPLGALR